VIEEKRPESSKLLTNDFLATHNKRYTVQVYAIRTYYHAK